MPVEVSMNTPLAEALQNDVQNKLVENGWVPGDSSDTTMAEYLVLMIVNGKVEDEITVELATDLLNLGPDDSSAREFSKWLFETIDAQNAKINGVPQAQAASAQGDGDQEMDMDLAPSDNMGDISAPTGPKAMRNGTGNFRGGRDKRVMGQINRILDRPTDSVLHRIRGQGGASDRINTHSRGGPNGRGGIGGFGNGRQQRHMNGRTTANFNHALAAAGMGGHIGGPPPNNGWMGGPPVPPGQSPMAPGMQPGPMDVYAMLEQQSRMMLQMQEQMQQQQQHLLQGGINNRRGGMNTRGRPLSDRGQRPYQNHKNFRNGNNSNGNGNSSGHQDIVLGDLGDLNEVLQKNNKDASTNEGEANNGAAAGGDDVDMGGGGGSGNLAETMCKFNLHCANKDCKFAHQSPVAPPGTTVDVHEVCSYGAACKNKKCTGRHPSPAARMAHQSEQDCKFYPNCTNPHCTFRHPAMPPCRNGGDCSVRGCKFTHVQTLCKFHPCTNRYCTFKHEEGQRGTFPGKVWTADGAANKEHISERKFVDESAPEETILPSTDKDMTSEEPVIT